MSNYWQQDRETHNPVQQSATCCTQAALQTPSCTLKGICQLDAGYSSVLLNPEVNAEMGRLAAATSEQRREVSVARISAVAFNSSRIWLLREIKIVEQKGQ